MAAVSVLGVADRTDVGAPPPAEGTFAHRSETIFVIVRRPHTRGELAGTGLGLATCTGIAERPGGSILLESRLGWGSTVRFARAEIEVV